MNYLELSQNQSRVAQDAKQVFGAYQEAEHALDQYRGGMAWKVSAGHEYLIRVTNRRGGNRSLGTRSVVTEKIYEDFFAAKLRLSERFTGLKQSLNELSGMARGVGINRVPNIVTATLRALDAKGLLGKNLIVIGTNAMYAFESVAGVLFDTGLLATMDMDLLWDARTSLKLGVQDDAVIDGGLLAVLQKVDKSFEVVGKGKFSAVNKDGFYIDLVRQAANPPWRLDDPIKMAPNDLTPAWLSHIQWLLSSPKFLSVVIGQDGIPAPMVAPDPRAFAIYKMWLSEQDEREPYKRRRDEAQAIAVLGLVRDRLPHLKLDEKAEQMFPKQVRRLNGLVD